MCGIAGIFFAEETKRVNARWVGSLSAGLKHRGPDDFGYLGWSDDHGVFATDVVEQLDSSRAVFIHRRLSIIDTSKLGWQPMQTEDGSFSIIFNGEIYNYLELRAELEQEGCTFRSHSDTEVLLLGYARWGKAVLSRLIGMFAYAILDLKDRCLFLARDPFGIKPLYYCVTKEMLGFASEATTLLEYPGISRRINPARLYDYMRFDVTDYGDETLWADIRQVPPAHYLEIPFDHCHTVSPQRYWRIPAYQPMDIGFDEAADHLRDLFLNSVQLHLRSDVPVGVCLSGGIDSSSIVMAMRRILGGSGDIHTFSYLATDERVNEKGWMDLVAHQAATKSHTTCPDESDLVASISDLVRTQGEPFGSTSIFAQYKLFELVSQAGIKVMLDGQGADEMLGGYWGYIAARIASHLAHGQVDKVLQLYRRSCSAPGISSGGLLALGVGLVLPPFLQTVGYRLIGRDLAPHWMNNRWFRDRGVIQAPTWKAEGPHHLRSQLAQSLERVSLPKLLRYEDRNSMRFSIESRVPFLIPSIVEFIYALPESYLVDPTGLTKSVFRAAMRGLVPDAILDRRDKIGFATSESDWQRALEPWIEQRLNSQAAHEIPAFEWRNLNDEWQIIRTGKRSFKANMWRWINLIEWAKVFDVDFQV